MVEAAPAARHGMFGGIQCLRFVAALMVVITHSTFYASERLTPGSYVWGRGTMGVDIFFVISGFVMYVSSIDLQGKSNGWKEFAAKRLIRIVPLYWAVTTLKLAILFAVPTAVLHSQVDWGFIAKSYFFIPAYNMDGNIEPLLGVGWTLIFEMFFYVLFTLSLLLRLPVLPTVSCVLAICAIGSLVRQPDWPAWAIYLDMRVLEFLAGMLIAKHFAGALRPLWIGVTAIVIGFGLIIFAPSAGAGLGRIVTLVIPASLVVYGVVSIEPHLAGRFPRWIVFLGAASYSLYLIHPIVAPGVPAVLAKLNIDVWVLSIAGSVATAIAAAIATYLAFEKPVTATLSKAWRKHVQVHPVLTPASRRRL